MQRDFHHGLLGRPVGITIQALPTAAHGSRIQGGMCDDVRQIPFEAATSDHV